MTYSGRYRVTFPAGFQYLPQGPSPRRLPPPTLALAQGGTRAVPAAPRSGTRVVAKWWPMARSNPELLGLPDLLGQFVTLGPRHSAPGRMWVLGFAPSTTLLPIFLHLHSAGAPSGKGSAPINTSHTCRWVTAARFTAQTSRNFSLPYCTSYSWQCVSCVVLPLRNEPFLLQPPVPSARLPMAPHTSQHF